MNEFDIDVENVKILDDDILENIIECYTYFMSDKEQFDEYYGFIVEFVKKYGDYFVTIESIDRITNKLIHEFNNAYPKDYAIIHALTKYPLTEHIDHDMLLRYFDVEVIK